MFINTSTDLPLPQNKTTLEIKHENDSKFFAKLLSKQYSMGRNHSFRVYHGGASGSVPFTWESRPGTPKHAFAGTSLVPPLTPPPSYYTKSNTKPVKKNSRSGLLNALFWKMVLRLKKANVVPSSSSTTSSGKYQRRRLSTPSSSFDSRMDDEGIAAVGLGTSTRCFSVHW
ncbi:hypothetical protein ES332_D02G006200v1 [Gossypium tomentosum]|uniref:Uncharacterized protein n=1 Tax=Gossypium tomentosum TaxID=34277 RepID=A0A5D2LS31_GOSTO|nr:hypothetical protein ES332_D02G006200v1 [Gossypium tomentosum]